jgi:hypothetical protein
MQTSDIAAQVVAILMPVVSGGASVAQGVATRLLGDLISQRLSRSEEGREAWIGFQGNPQNNSLVRHLLRQEMDRDVALREKIEELLQKANDEVRDRPVQQAIGNKSSRNIQVGGNVTGNVAGRDNKTTNTKKSQGGAIVGVVAIVVIVVLAIVVYGGVKVVDGLMKSSKDGGLTANSTCQQFLNTDEEDERQALADIGISMGYSAYSNPLALPEIQYECGGDPTITLGALIQRDGSNG